MILVQLARAGTDNAIIKQLAHKKSASEHKNVITQTGLFVFFTSIILCLIMALLSFFNMFPIYESELARFVLYSFLIITLIFSFIQVLASYFQSQVMVYSQYWSLGLGVSFAGVVACLAVYWMNLNVLYLSVFFIILCFFVALSCLVIFSFKLNKLPIENDVKDFNKLNFKRTLTYTLPYTAIAFIMIIIQQGGALLSGFWLTETELALISVAFRLSTLVGFMFVAFCALLAPKISIQFEKGRFASIHDESIKLIAISNAFSIGMFLSFVFFGEMILLVFGKDYQNSYLVLVIFSFCWVLRSFVGPLGTILTMTKNLKGLRINLYMSALVIFSSCIILIPLYGAVGAAISSLLGTITMCITNAITVNRKLGIRFYTFNSLKLQIICLSNLVNVKKCNLKK